MADVKPVEPAPEPVAPTAPKPREESKDKFWSGLGQIAPSAFVSAFKQNITNCAKDNHWKLSEITDTYAVLELVAESGTVQTLYVNKFPNTIEFSIPSAYAFKSDQDLGEASTALLERNADLRIGYWCLEKIDKKWTFEVMHNEPLDQLDANYFGDIVASLVKECDEFEQSMDED